MIYIEELSPEKFAEFGTFLNPVDCGSALGDDSEGILFFPDRMIQQFKLSTSIAISSLQIKPRALVITITENHRETEEVIGGFTRDVCFHVGPAGARIPAEEKFKVFRLPAGWWVRIKKEVWHQGPFVLGNDSTLGIVVLPPETYKHDCNLVKLEKPLVIGFKN